MHLNSDLLGLNNTDILLGPHSNPCCMYLLYNGLLNPRERLSLSIYVACMNT